MSIEELKPCPFCGSADIQPAPRRDFPVQCRCRECGTDGPAKLTGHEADAAWNTRPTEDALRARIAELERVQFTTAELGQIIREADWSMLLYDTATPAHIAAVCIARKARELLKKGN